MELTQQPIFLGLKIIIPYMKNQTSCPNVQESSSTSNVHMTVRDCQGAVMDYYSSCSCLFKRAKTLSSKWVI